MKTTSLLPYQQLKRIRASMFKISSYLALIFFTIMHLDLNSAECGKCLENLPQQKVDEMGKKSSAKIKPLRGREIIPYIHKIAALRIAIFREYPYLYEGDMSYEERYLLMYSRTEDAI